MKLFIYTTNIEEALRGNFEFSLNLSTRDDLVETGDDWRLIGEDDWTLIGEVEHAMDIDRDVLTQKAVSNLGEQIQKVKAASHAAVTQLETRQQNLLALTNESKEVINETGS